MKSRVSDLGSPRTTNMVIDTLNYYRGWMTGSDSCPDAKSLNTSSFGLPDVTIKVILQIRGGVELVIHKAIDWSSDGKTMRNEFINEAAKATRFSLFTRIETNIYVSFESLSSPQTFKGPPFRGGVRAAYRGVTMGLIGICPYSAIDMGTFELDLGDTFDDTTAKKYEGQHLLRSPPIVTSDHRDQPSGATN
ncbi:hypothetical protein HD806DRAFT_541185 [Xylariaceae sp. AK1471]|nr:hypothetical protein HD806DRAFT_541185 [Xylariaceae sp. AK1471]